VLVERRERPLRVDGHVNVSLATMALGYHTLLFSPPVAAVSLMFCVRFQNVSMTGGDHSERSITRE